MSVQNALTFLRIARCDEKLRGELAARQELEWDELVRLGEQVALEFTIEELQHAHVLDWRMRWARYSSEAKGVDPDPE